MANLTGEYDVVIEVGVNVLNGILGAVHQNQDTNFPTMPHSLDLLVNDTPRGPGDPVPEGQRTGVQSRVEIQVSTPIVSLPVDTLEVRPEFGRAALGVQTTASGAPDRSEGIRAGLVRGGGIVVHPTSFGEPRITAKVLIRAWVRDPVDEKLPEFIHGDLFVTTTLIRSEVSGVGTFLTLDRTNGPLVSFQPAAGTTITEEQRRNVATIVSNVIKSDMDPATFKVALPDEITHFDFTFQAEARRPSVMALLTLTDRTPGPAAPRSVSAGLLPDGSDFAVAVGGDFIIGLLGDSLLAGLHSSYSYSKLGVSATIRPKPPVVSLEAGRIVVSVTGNGTISWFGIDDHFTFSIRQAFGLRVAGGGLEPFADGDPVVDLDDVAVGGDYLQGKVRDTIRDQRDAALAAGAEEFRKALDVAKQLEAILAGINPVPAAVTVTDVQIRPEGLLVSGTIGLAATGPVVVSETLRFGFNDALDSWIPGGTIDRFVWEQSSFRPTGSLSRVDQDRFVTEPMGVSIFSSLCLRIEGTRVTAGGGLVPVSASACFRFSPVVSPVSDLPGDTPAPLLPLQEQVGDQILVVGHFDPFAPGRLAPKGQAGVLVVFDGDGSGDAHGLVREALAGRKRRAPLIPLVVTGREAGPAVSAGGDYVVVEDPSGAWASALGVPGATGAVLVGPRGGVAWSEAKGVSAKKIAAALEKLAGGESEVATNTIRLSVSPGDRIPNLPLRLADGSELSLRRLRGRSLAVAFWTSRSEPSLDHLEFLRDLVASRGSEAPLVIAIGDGESLARTADVAERRNLQFTMLADPDRFLARAFGVWCWPATVWVRPDLTIEAVDFGSAAGAGARSYPDPKGPGQGPY